MLNVVRMPSCSFMEYNTYITWKHLEKNFGPTFQVRPKICSWPPDYNAASVSVQAVSAVQALMLAVVALKQPAIEC